MAFTHAIALTGSIATGKSTTVSLLQLNGFRVIDADSVAHEQLQTHYEWVAKQFGAQYVVNTKVDRAKLGALIFENTHAKQELEAFLHPKIYEQILHESEKQERFSFPYLIDIPLFFENRRYDIAHSVVVYAPFDIQIKRLMKRNHFTYEEAKRRIQSQWPIDQKRDLATWVIDNSKDLKHLQHEIEAFTAVVTLAHEKGEI